MGALKYLKGTGEQAKSFYGEGSWGKHFPELKPFVFQGAGSFVGIPACIKATAYRKPSIMVLWLCHSNVDKSESETPLCDIIQNKCDMLLRVLSEVHVVQGKIRYAILRLIKALVMLLH